jgi:hypothetical protein
MTVVSQGPPLPCSTPGIDIASAIDTPAASRVSSPSMTGPTASWATDTASANCEPSANRRCGSRAVASATSSSTIGGMLGSAADGGGTSLSIWLRTTTKSVGPVCGGEPVSISYSTMPAE